MQLFKNLKIKTPSHTFQPELTQKKSVLAAEAPRFK